MKNLIILLFSFVNIGIFVNAQNIPILKGPYLGQKPPGMIPEIFAPGIISTGYYERSIVFSPTLDEIFYQLRGLRFTTFILTSKIQNGIWKQPEVALFSGYPEYCDDCPFFNYEGNTLLFVSKRPIPGTQVIQKESDIWFLRKDSNGWGQPEYSGSILNSSGDDDYPTVSKMNNIYFCSNRDGNYDIYVSEYSESGYSKPVRINAPISTEKFEGHPFIAADESYLIFSSDRPGELGQADLYISFRKKDNSWSEPINMGDKINTPFHEAAPYVSPDGKYLFFCSFRPNYGEYYSKKLEYNDIKKHLNSPGNGNGDIYWIDARVIEELRMKN